MIGTLKTLILIILMHSIASGRDVYQLTYDSTSSGHVSWSPDGNFIAFESERSGNKDIWIMQVPDGEAVQITSNPADDCQPDWSPNGENIVFYSDRSDEDCDIWVYDIPGDSLYQLTTYTGIDWSPKWSPDGSAIAYVSDQGGSLDIWTIPAEGGGPEQITDDPNTEWGPDWSPDGTKIAFIGFASANNDIWIISSDGNGEPSQVTTYSGHDLLASWSPAGTELCFGSNRSGNLDIWIIDTLGDSLTQVTTSLSDEGNPDWSPDGNKIAFESNQNGSWNIWYVDLRQFTRITEGPHVNDGGGSVGACWVDYDGDSFPDLYVLNEGNAVISNDNFLYHNEGDGTFSKVLGVPPVMDGSDSYSATLGDYDNDGDVDLVVANFKGNANILYLNDGFGGFTIDEDCAISEDAAGSTSASWIDYDSDGDLDIYIANSSNDLAEYPPHENFLYRNNDGTFERILSGDIVTVSRHTYGNSWSDFDNDGDPDLVNSNSMYAVSDMFQNDGSGDFIRLSTSFLGSDTTNGGGACWADYDNDSDMDLFLASFWPGPSLLFENDGDGSLTKVLGHGLGDASGRATGGTWADYDNDGDLDIFVWLNDFQVPSNAKGYLYENDGSGTFSKVPAEEFECDSCRANSSVWGDFDRDGDMDIFITRANWDIGHTDNILFRNNGNSNQWISIKPIGTNSNRSAIGAKIRLLASIDGLPRWQMRELRSQTGGHSQGPLELHYGLGDAMIVDSIRIEWPRGMVDIYTDVSPNQFITYTETICGDADGNGSINLLDVTFLIGYLYKGGTTPEHMQATDPDGNGSINLLDITYLISFLYKGGSEPTCI